MERIERHASFGGWQDVYQHESSSLGCTMKFGVYLLHRRPAARYLFSTGSLA